MTPLLPLKAKVTWPSGGLEVPVAHRGQAERAVGPGVLGVADPDQGHFEQADDRGEHLLARQARALRDPHQDAGPDRGEGDLPKARVRPVFGPVADRPPLADDSGTASGPFASRPVAWRWPSGRRADPDLGPGRGDRQGLDPGQVDLGSRKGLPCEVRGR